MTRENLIKAINDNEDGWSCPEYQCNAPEEENNTGVCCLKCTERQLEEYENKIRADEIKEITKELRESDLVTFSQAIDFLGDKLEQLKEHTNG